MICKHYQFAGLEFSVEMPPELMYEKDDRLEPFRVETVKDPHRFRFEKVEKLTEPSGCCVTKQPDFLIYQNGSAVQRYVGLVAGSWERALLRSSSDCGENRVQLRAAAFPGRVSSRTVLDAFAAEHLIVRSNGVVFHCSYIDRNGKAVLFTAPSQTGKSTQADLWHKHRDAEIINGDRAAIRIADGQILAEGIPFSGSSPYCKNRSLPLEAIVYLGQAPKTTIRKLRGFEAFSRVWEGISVNTWDRMDLELASQTVKKIVESVPVYHMPCTPDEDAVLILEQELRKQAQL